MHNASPSGIKILKCESIKISGSREGNIPLSVLEHTIEGDLKERYCHSLGLQGGKGMARD